MRKLLLLFLFLLAAHASEIEILSGKIDINSTIITASEDVVVLYGDMLIAAKKMHYDKANKLLDLEGDIHILQGSMYYAIGEKMHMDVGKEQSILSPLFIHEKSNDLWLATKDATVDHGVYKLKNAILSSCNPVDPEWRIKYSTGTYDTKKKWVNLYNMVLYAGDVPFFYSPYYGFATDDTRTSGFLRPEIGFSALEGFFFEQPFYLVGSDRWDLELRYQLRSLRGEGVFSTLRFVDSATSKGSINFGFFREKNSNQAALGWVNEIHKGVEVNYDHAHLLDGLYRSGVTDELYTDINYYNDVDYINLQILNGQTTQTPNIVTSKINYVVSGDDQYLGVYGKYFLDNSSIDNLETLQELPQIQYHKFINTFLLDRLTYAVDYSALYRTRPYLPSAFETYLTVPISYTLPLFSEYLNLSIRENLTLSKINFTQVTDSNLFRDGEYLNGSQVATINTDLTKKYDQNIHTVNVGVSYQFPGAEYKTGFYTNSNGEFDATNCQIGDPCEFAQGSIEPFKRYLHADLTQFIYNNKGEELIYHKFSQPLDVENNSSLGTLENELRIRLTDTINFYNNLQYSYSNRSIEKSLSTISYNSQNIKMSVTHRFVNQILLNNYSKYYTFTSQFGPWDNYSYEVQYSYDAIAKRAQNWKIGIKMKKRCWSYQISYTENIRPSTFSSVTDRFIYFNIKLIPALDIDYQYDIINQS